MSLSPEAVIRILESRYDHLSARAVFQQIVEKSGVDAKGPYDGAAANKLASALLEVGNRVDATAASLREGASGGGKADKGKSAKSTADEKPEAKGGKADEANKQADDAKKSEEGKKEDDAGDDSGKSGGRKRRARKSSSGSKKK